MILRMLSLQGIHNNFFELSTLLIVDENVMLTDSKQKLKIDLSTTNATLTFLLQNATLAFKCGSC